MIAMTPSDVSLEELEKQHIQHVLAQLGRGGENLPATAHGGVPDPGDHIADGVVDSHWTLLPA